jgi:hypothetical protein
MTTQLVVARYTESFEWTQSGGYDVVVYNKSGVEDARTIPLPNVGREAHTYLYHIVHNYDTLADVTLFLQSKISDHGYEENVDHVVSQLGASAQKHGFSDNTRSTKRGQSVFTDPDFNLKIRDVLTGRYGVSPSSVGKITFYDWFIRYIDPLYPDTLTWYENAVFAVSKDRIRSRSKEFYEVLLSQLSTESAPIEAHFLERSWFYVFNCHKYSRA